MVGTTIISESGRTPRSRAVVQRAASDRAEPRAHNQARLSATATRVLRGTDEAQAHVLGPAVRCTRVGLVTSHDASAIGGAQAKGSCERRHCRQDRDDRQLGRAGARTRSGADYTIEARASLESVRAARSGSCAGSHAVRPDFMILRCPSTRLARFASRPTADARSRRQTTGMTIAGSHPLEAVQVFRGDPAARTRSMRAARSRRRPRVSRRVFNAAFASTG